MPLFARNDGARPADDLSVTRRLMVALQPRRAESVVFFGATLPAERALALLDRINEDRLHKVTFYHLVLAAIARTMHQRPRLNRFVKGGVVYQRPSVSLSFAVKKGMNDDAKLTAVKVNFDQNDGIDDVARKVNEQIHAGRSSAPTKAERTSGNLFRWLPDPLLSWVLWAAEKVELAGLTPASMLRSDPLQTSANVANLGSIGIDGCYHHLFNHGSSSMMISLGRVAKRPVVTEDGQVVAAETVDIKFAIDERICDGFYLARSLEQLLHLMENPEVLAEDLDEGRLAAK